MPKSTPPSAIDVAANAASVAGAAPAGGTSSAAAVPAAVVDPKAMTVNVASSSTGTSLDVLAVQMSPPTQKLQFDSKTDNAGCTVSAILKIHNKGTDPLLLRCWSSCPGRYCIVPSRGVIRPDQMIDINLRMAESCVESLTLMLEDRIMIALAPCSNGVDLAIEGALSVQPLESPAQLFDSPSAYDKCGSPDACFKKAALRSLLAVQVEYTPPAQRRVLAILSERQRQCMQCACKSCCSMPPSDSCYCSW